jgi:hypothetical protein
MILLGLLLIFLAGCASLTTPANQQPKDICNIPARPVIDDSDIQLFHDQGDTWVGYRQDQNERLLKHIQRLENSLESCSNR